MRQMSIHILCPPADLLCTGHGGVSCVQTENVLQVVLSHSAGFVAIEVNKKAQDGHDKNKNSNYHGCNDSHVDLDINIKLHSDSPPAVTDGTGVQPFIRKSYRADSENAAIGGGGAI